MFDKKIQDCLQYYIYALKDPRNNQYFYIGRGSGNRCYSHLRKAKYHKDASEKTERINAIRKAGYEPQIDIIRHGIEDIETVKEVEAALIDAFWLEDLENEVSGSEHMGTGSLWKIAIFVNLTSIQAKMPAKEEVWPG